MQKITVDGTEFRSRSAYAKHLILNGEMDANTIAEKAGIKVPLVYYLFYSLGVMKKESRPVNKTLVKKVSKIVTSNLSKIMSVTTEHNGKTKTLTVRINKTPTDKGCVSAVEFNKSRKYHVLNLNYVKQIKVGGEVHTF